MTKFLINASKLRVFGSNVALKMLSVFAMVENVLKDENTANTSIISCATMSFKAILGLFS